MTCKSYLFHCLSFTLVALLLVACSSSGPSATAAPTVILPTEVSASDMTPDDDIAEPTASTPISVGGPGALNLTQPGAHLDSLSRYQAELQTRFSGTQNGQALERSTHLTLAYAGPGAQVTRLESRVTGEEPIFLLAGEVAGTRFIQSASDAPCSSLVDSEDTETPTFGDPWSEIPAIYGAELMGEETVNGFETEHYTFDQRAIRWAAETTAEGELWIAKDGGFLVRYRLSMQAPAGVLSAAEGEQTWQFDLNPLSEDANLLPESCAPVLTDFPMLPDASQSLRMPGFLSYLTGSDLNAAAEFYRQELATAGWQEQDAFNVTPERTVLFFVRPITEDDDTVTMQEVATITLGSSAPTGFKIEIQTLRTAVPPPTEEGQ
ncbi:MAG: hypothetical protein JW892_16745 [Anaerolineae bacterium]|nr:hypothetical protein [Anaerolineae bacterium]